MGNPRFQYTPQMATTIRSLAGTHTAREIAEVIGAPNAMSVKEWASRNDLSLKRPPSRSPSAVYANLKQIATQKGLRFSMSGRRVTLWIPFRSHMLLDDAEAFLRGYRPMVAEPPPPLRGRRPGDSLSETGVSNPRAHAVSAAEVSNIAELARQGHGSQEIGRRIGRAPSAVRRAAKRNNIALPGRAK